MLVLTLKIDQSVFIDGRIRVTVLGVEHRRVKIGITAAPYVKVVRDELLKRVGGQFDA